MNDNRYTGPYNAVTEAERQINLNKLNDVAVRVYQLGHITIIGVNVVLPVLKAAGMEYFHEAMMEISKAVVANCDALLLVEESPGAKREKDRVLKLKRTVYSQLSEIPIAVGRM